MGQSYTCKGRSFEPKTKAVYLPLIDMPPAHPDTIMTAMSKAQRMTQEIGQTFTLFTADQQLYRVALEVQWTHPNFIPRLGGMHMLMSFVGAIGALMTETCLAQILESVFGGVEKMLTGKKFVSVFKNISIILNQAPAGDLFIYCN